MPSSAWDPDAVDAHLMVAVKSDAYGHGEQEIATTALASGAHSLAVLDIDTGVRLRPHVGDAMLLAWLLSPADDFSQRQFLCLMQPNQYSMILAHIDPIFFVACSTSRFNGHI